MSIWSFLEFEEQIGRRWHSLVGKQDSYPHYVEAAVSLDSVRHALGVYFRGLGGTPAIELTSGGQCPSSHRLKLLQRLGMERESTPIVEGDDERILLPETIDYFPSSALNRRLYFWLAAFFATSKLPCPGPPDDPLQADLSFLRYAYQTSLRVCRQFPGLAKDYQALCSALREQRPARKLPRQERAVEGAIQVLLGGSCPDPLGNGIYKVLVQPGGIYKTFVQSGLDFKHWQAVAGYRPFLPVPLWGMVRLSTVRSDQKTNTYEQEDGDSHEIKDSSRKKGRRELFEQSERDDPLLLNRFEKLMSWSEMVNINRAVQDDDLDSAKDAAKAIEEINLSPHQRHAATRLKFDLDLAPTDVSPAALITEQTYPEWDFKQHAYHANQCRIVFQNAEENSESWEPSLQTRRRFRKVRRQFEALRPRRERLRHQVDGAELDMDALVRSQCDFLANGSNSEQVFLKIHRQARDLAVAILVDVSLSTDSWVNDRRILDIEKETLITLATGLTACRDAFAIYTFTSRKRDYVRVTAVKHFSEAFNSNILRRITALRPGYYTRMGAALRHTQFLLNKRPERHRLILLLTDGKPNDLDYYEGRYGIEDTRHAILEARRAGLSVFGITIDRKAKDYFPYLFGRGRYAIVAKPDRLSHILPMIYRQLVS